MEVVVVVCIGKCVYVVVTDDSVANARKSDSLIRRTFPEFEITSLNDGAKGGRLHTHGGTSWGLAGGSSPRTRKQTTSPASPAPEDR